ncbi:ABC transporter ATP-binding protein [Candidatus Peregrinibacteria bacterium]|nr:ABC transporter ATP-binding protein [Candidatus Peregrinibacteria bacterium]
MLEIKNLTAGYGNGPDVIKNINLKVREGEIVTIIGPNGAGKSTILRSIFGLTSIRNGEINLSGENLVNQKTDQIIKHGVCYVPQGRSVFSTMTVEENLQMGAYILNDKKEIDGRLGKIYSRFPNLYAKRKCAAQNLSGGQQQMVSLGRALMLNPKLLLLDEPSIGLSPKLTMEVFENCRTIKKNGTSILIIEQNANIALQYTDHAYVLEMGENRLDGKGKELLKNKKVGKLYLGR